MFGFAQISTHISCSRCDACYSFICLHQRILHFPQSDLVLGFQTKSVSIDLCYNAVESATLCQTKSPFVNLIHFNDIFSVNWLREGSKYFMLWDGWEQFFKTDMVFESWGWGKHSPYNYWPTRPRETKPTYFRCKLAEERMKYFVAWDWGEQPDMIFWVMRRRET